MKLSGWGNYPIKNTKVFKPKNLEELLDALKFNQTIARGNGRSYGDSSVGFYKTIDMKNFSKIISFDYKKGLLVAESGVLLKNIISDFNVTLLVLRTFENVSVLLKIEKID